MHLLTRATDYDAGARAARAVAARDRAELRAPPHRDARDGRHRRHRRRSRRRSTSATPESALVAQLELESLRRAIAALPPHYRDVLVLVELAERSYAEVAGICGLELNTVRSRLFRARALLARWLALDAESPGARSSAA